ncbi:MAG: YbhN family protein [Rhodocyclaceae bacterium]|nr:YbhN family protein [Rhodocyclaceae bacterium]MDZ4213475.1 YbhN family protein [Rhodocyclaceae bacterium]
MTAQLDSRPWIRLAKKVLWLTGVGLVIAWSLWLLYSKLRGEVAADPVAKELLASGGFWLSLKIIAESIGNSIRDVPGTGYALAALSALLAYIALAWYDRIALIHLNRQQEISWPFIASCSFVTYALGHNLGASVLSGGLVRLRAYGACGLGAGEVAILVALCSFTFAFGTILLTGFVFVVQPDIVQPLAEMVPRLNLPAPLVQMIGAIMLGLCALYVLGSWLHFKPVHFRSVHIVYPRLPVVVRQLMAAPLELIAAAGIIYFVLPEAGNPGFIIVLGAFLLSFSAGLLSQTPGGIGVMEAVFLAVLPSVAPSNVIAALLIWRLMYLLIPLAISLPLVVAFERAQLRRAAK